MTDTIACPVHGGADGQPSIDINDGRLYDDPWETYRWLRANAPVHWDAKNELWVISRHADVAHVSPPTRSCTAPQSACGPRWRRRCRSSRWTTPSTPASAASSTRASPRRRSSACTDHIRELANQIIDEIADRGELDFVEDFAIHVPLIVIAELMGLDPEQPGQPLPVDRRHDGAATATPSPTTRRCTAPPRRSASTSTHA